VLDYLDPKNELFQYRLYRHNCVKVQMESDSIYVKDLRIFKNVSMNDMIIIDNSVLSFAFHLENGIPILPYYNNPDDYELKVLTNYLNNISQVKDLREENRRVIKMDYFLHAVKGDIPLEELIAREENEDTDGEENNKEDETSTIFALNFCGRESNVSTSIIDTSSVIQTTPEKENINPCDKSLNSNAIFVLNNCNVNNDKPSTNKKAPPKRRNTIIQDQLFSTLEDLKTTFTRINEKKKSIKQV
jgi:hypothetical protein